MAPDQATTRDIYNRLSEINSRLGGLESTTSDIKGMFDRLPCGIDGKRINDLETFRDTLTGKMTIIGVVAGFIGSCVLAIINYLLGKS